MTDLLAIAVVVGIGLLSCAFVSSSRLPLAAKQVLCAAVALRFVGAYARQLMAADARPYFREGAACAEYFARFDLAPLFDSALWRGSQWYGTNFMSYPTGLVMMLLGSSWLATFFAFGLLSLLGLVAYAAAYRRSFPGVPYRAYWAWIFLLPSLWFWPSSIGKEAVMTIGLGVAVLGYAGRNGRENWWVLSLGLALIFCVRPQLVTVFLFSVLLAYWLRFEAWTPHRVMQGIVMVAVGLVGIWFSLATTLGGEVEVEAVEEYVNTNAAHNDHGGSSIEAVGANPARIPLAVVNVLFRPFIWEAHNAASLISALEVLLIWWLVWFRRRELRAALVAWRHNRMLRFAIPFVALYVVALGMNLSNLGLVARQRVLVFPLLFLVVEAGVYFRRHSLVVHQPQPWRKLWPSFSPPGEPGLAASHTLPPRKHAQLVRGATVRKKPR